MPSDDLFAERRRKVDELRARGIESYGVDFAPSATIEEARRLLTTYETDHPDAEVDAADRPVVSVAGRVMQLRDLGGAAFAHVEDETGRMQMWFRADRPGGAHALVAMLDLGDIVGITGPLTRTRRGEPSVLVELDDAPRQVAARAAGEVSRAPGPGDEVPQALPRPAQRCLAAAALRDALATDPRAPRHARTAWVSRGRDTDPATDSGRWRRSAVPHALERAAHRRVPAYRHRAAPQAPACRRLRACVRDRTRLPQRRLVAAPQPGVHHARGVPGIRDVRRHARAHRGAHHRRRQRGRPAGRRGRGGWQRAV